VLFIITQQVQPALSMQLMQSQQAWIISQHLASPLVQVMQQPSLVMSHLHMPMVRLQQQTIIPFIIMQQLHMPPASMVHRFCIMPQAIWSLQLQVIFMPPWHFSTFMVQRGTIIMFMPAGMPIDVPIPGAVMPGVVIPAIVPRSIIIVAMVLFSSQHAGNGPLDIRRCVGLPAGSPLPPAQEAAYEPFGLSTITIFSGFGMRQATLLNHNPT